MIDDCLNGFLKLPFFINSNLLLLVFMHLEFHHHLNRLHNLQKNSDAISKLRKKCFHWISFEKK